MKIAETVTCGGSGFDRAAELRESAASIWAQPESRSILLWRGKPLVHNADLVRLPTDHLVFAKRYMQIFLGKTEAQAPLFAADISAWEPESFDAESLNTFLDPTEQNHPDLPADHGFLELRTIMTGLTAEDAELAATAKAVFGWHRSHQFCSACGSES